jgi:hypothetical protein
MMGGHLAALAADLYAFDSSPASEADWNFLFVVCARVRDRDPVLKASNVTIATDWLGGRVTDRTVRRRKHRWVNLGVLKPIDQVGGAGNAAVYRVFDEWDRKQDKSDPKGGQNRPISRTPMDVLPGNRGDRRENNQDTQGVLVIRCPECRRPMESTAQGLRCSYCEAST